jgi:hypothetical protein
MNIAKAAILTICDIRSGISLLPTSHSKKANWPIHKSENAIGALNIPFTEFDRKSFSIKKMIM